MAGTPYSGKSYSCLALLDLYAVARPLFPGSLSDADVTAFGTEPHALHRIRRTPLNPFFSQRAVTSLQPQIEELIEDLCNGLRECMRRGDVVELRPAFLSLAIDVIFRYGEPKTFLWMTSISLMLHTNALSKSIWVIFWGSERSQFLT